MATFESYSLLKILDDLKAKGYSRCLTIKKGKAHFADSNKSFAPETMLLVGTYRVEGDSNNDEEAVIYALKTQSGEKGTIIDSFGPHADPEKAEFISKVKEDPSLTL
jgi:hypothetical protein